MNNDQQKYFADHLLVILMEECAEVQQAASKCFRFGLTEENHSNLLHEFNDLLAVVEMLEDNGLGTFLIDYEKLKIKKEKVLHYYRSYGENK